MTRRVFQEALTELLSDKPMNKISVSEICKNADMNRSTFYSHYQDQFELLEEIRDGFFDKLYTVLNGTYPENYFNNLEIYMTYIYDNREIFLILIRETNDFTDRVITVASDIYEKTKKLPKTENSNDDERLKLQFLVGGGLYVTEKWLTDASPIPPKQMTKKLCRLSLDILGKKLW